MYNIYIAKLFTWIQYFHTLNMNDLVGYAFYMYDNEKIPALFVYFMSDFVGNGYKMSMEGFIVKRSQSI